MRLFGINIFLLIGGGLLAIIVLQVVALFVGARVTPRPDNVNNGSLDPCPSSPNCVSTVDSDEQHGMPPIPYQSSLAEAKGRLMAILAATPRVTIVTEQERYVYVEVRSATMGFVDDVEFLFDDDAKEIQFRSAARLGYGDMGVNRKRMETISTEFAQSQ